MDCSLSESKVVKLAINVVLNVLTQTRSLVASRLIEDDTHWDCTAQGTANRMKKSLVYCHYFKIKPDGTDILPMLSWDPLTAQTQGRSTQSSITSDRGLLAQLQPHFDPCQY